MAPKEDQTTFGTGLSLSASANLTVGGSPSAFAMVAVEGVLSPESPMHDNAARLAQELSSTAKSLRSLVEMLERSPQSLLFGRKPTGEKQ